MTPGNKGQHLVHTITNILFPSLIWSLFLASMLGINSLISGWGDARLIVYYVMTLILVFVGGSIILLFYGKLRKIPCTAFNIFFLLCTAFASFIALYFLYFLIRHFIEATLLMKRLSNLYYAGSAGVFSGLLFLWLSGIQKKAYKLCIVFITFLGAFLMFFPLDAREVFRKEITVDRKGPNILLITIDSLRYDYLGCNGNREIITPHIDDLANKGIVFDRFYVQAPYTTTSLSTLLTGCYPFHHGARVFGQKPDRQYETFIQALLKEGYSVETDGAFIAELFPDIAEYNTAFFDKNIPLHKSIQHNLSVFKYVLNDLLGDCFPSLFGQYCFSNKTSMRKTSKLIEHVRLNRNRPWFYWAHYTKNVHYPYEALPNFIKLYSDNKKLFKTSIDEDQINYLNKNIGSITEKLKQEIKVLYSAEVSCIDAQIGMIIKSLQKFNLLGDTVVLISADHGELLGEHNFIGHGQWLKDPLLHVPLIMYAPGYFKEGKRIASFVEEVDIAPTILDIGKTSSTLQCDGRSLLDILNGREWNKHYIYAEVYKPSLNTYRICYRTDEYKLVWMSATNKFELYHLLTDPGEKEDIAEKFPEASKKLQKELIALAGPEIFALQKRDWKFELDEDMKHIMKALGYLK